MAVGQVLQVGVRVGSLQEVPTWETCPGLEEQGLERDRSHGGQRRRFCGAC